MEQRCDTGILDSDYDGELYRRGPHLSIVNPRRRAQTSGGSPSKGSESAASIWGNAKMRWVAFTVLCLALLGCTKPGWLNWYPDDNPVEEAVEEVIELETGLEIDLTPWSPE